MKIDYLSPSRTKLYETCPFQYFLKYYLDVPKLSQPTIATHKGSAVHYALELYAKGDKDYTKNLKDYYSQHDVWYFDNRPAAKGFTHPQSKGCETCPWAVTAGKSFICTIANRPVAQFDGCPRGNFEDDLALCKAVVEKEDSPLKKKILGAEVPFTEQYDGFKVHGFIDLIVEIDENTIEVMDYKTGNWTQNTDEAFEDIQMRLYSVVAKKLYPSYKYVLMTLNYLRKGPVTVIFDKNDDEETKDFLRTMYSKIEADKDPVRIKSFKCSWCVGYDQCGKIREKFLDEKGKFKLPE